MSGIESPRMSSDDADFCEGLVTIAEATEVIKNLKTNKAPGIL